MDSYESGYYSIKDFSCFPLEITRHGKTFRVRQLADEKSINIHLPFCGNDGEVKFIFIKSIITEICDES